MEYSYHCRVHLFPNGTLMHGKALAFERTASFGDILSLASKKFNIKHNTPTSTSAPGGINDGHHMNPYSCPYPRLFTIKGTEIGEVNEILNDDVLVYVPPNEEFVPPLPIEQVILGTTAPRVHAVPTASTYHQYGGHMYGSSSPVSANHHHQQQTPVYPNNDTSNFQTPTRPKNKIVPSTLQAISPLLHNVYQSPAHYSPNSAQQQFAQPPYAMDVYEQRHVVSHPYAHIAHVMPQMNFIPEIYLHIFSFLDHKDVLLNIALVSKSWNAEYSKSELLWKELCMNVYCFREKRRRSHTGYMPQINDDNIPDKDSFTLEELRKTFIDLVKPPMEYKSWKTYFRYYILWAGAITWDTTERGPNIKFLNQNMTVTRDDNITYHWQTVRSSIPIHVPSEKQKMTQGGVILASSNGTVTDDVALYEWEIVINKFDRSHSNGWWIVIGLETELFSYKESTPTNLIGYDRHMGWGYACGNGDSLHCYSNTSLKNKQPYTCDPVNAWMNVPYAQGDIVRVRLKFFTKCCVDTIDPKENIGATLDYFVNGKWMGQAFRNITGTVYPAVSLLTNQSVTLKHVDPILNKLVEKQQAAIEQKRAQQLELEQTIGAAGSNNV